jgi:ribose transport system substrate-binding protein
VANSPQVIGETAVTNTLALLDGKKEVGKTAKIPLALITKDNLDEAPRYCPA